MCSTVIGDVLYFLFAAIDGAGPSFEIGVGVGVGVSLLIGVVVVICVFRRTKQGTCTYVNLCMLITYR